MFYILITLIALLAVAVMLSPLWHELSGGEEAEDLAVYKAQLGEIEKDVEKGVLSTEDAEIAKLEVSRRLLAADKRQKSLSIAASKQLRGVALGLGAASVLCVILAASSWRMQPLPMVLNESLKQTISHISNPSSPTPVLP